jgi:4,5-DOPA dioxygenase extradiol
MRPSRLHFILRLAKGEDVLIVGSWLPRAQSSHLWLGQHPRDPYDRAVHFENAAKMMMQARGLKQLVRCETVGTDEALSIRTLDHYLPLLYVLAAGSKANPSASRLRRLMGGSISMLALQIG